MTFLALRSANAFNGYAIHFFILDVVMEFFINTIKLITLPGFFIQEVYFRFPVTVDTPAHAEILKLVYFRHFLDIAMALLALNLAYLDVLRVVEINVVWEVVDLCPGYRA